MVKALWLAGLIASSPVETSTVQAYHEALVASWKIIDAQQEENLKLKKELIKRVTPKRVIVEKEAERSWWEWPLMVGLLGVAVTTTAVVVSNSSDDCVRH